VRKRRRTRASLRYSQIQPLYVSRLHRRKAPRDMATQMPYKAALLFGGARIPFSHCNHCTVICCKFRRCLSHTSDSRLSKGAPPPLSRVRVALTDHLLSNHLNQGLRTKKTGNNSTDLINVNAFALLDIGVGRWLVFSNYSAPPRERILLDSREL
jgi:hypothetical protein